MISVLSPSVAAATPTLDQVLAFQGVPPDAAIEREVHHLMEEARQMFVSLAQPRAVMRPVSSAEAALLLNDCRSESHSFLVADVLGLAHACTLFALTIGEDLCEEISRQCATGDIALGTALDAFASEGADSLCTALSQQIHADKQRQVLSYSPGYCGWPISGQAALLEAVEAKRIGISLNPHHVMRPLKSISGIFVAADIRAHDQGESYPFCETCDNRTCRDRIRNFGVSS